MLIGHVADGSPSSSVNQSMKWYGARESIPRASVKMAWTWLTPSSSRGMCPWSAMLRSQSQPWLWGWQALNIDRWGRQAGRGGKAILLTWNDPTASGFHYPSHTILLKAFTGSPKLLGLGIGDLLQAEPSLTCTPGQVFMQTEHSPMPPSWQGPGSR